MKILVPAVEPLRAPLPGVDVVEYDTRERLPDAHLDAEVLVAWDVSRGWLRDAAARLHSLRWVQSLSAGMDAFMTAGFAPEVILTSGRGLHDATVGEHALALILAAARDLPTMVRGQIGHRWVSELGGTQPEGRGPKRFTTLAGSRVTIWGYGSIGRWIAPHLQALGASVTGIATSRRREGEVDVHTHEALPEILPSTDVLLMIVPATPETQNALDETMLRALPPHAWVVNVGRGATVDEDALVVALRDGVIAGAALDVTKQEPLPVASPLWDLPNVIITPHSAGGRPRGADELIASNLAALREGRELRNVVEH